MNYPYLDSTDLPSDPNGSLGSLRVQLRIAYNGARSPENAHRMKLLRSTLAHVVALIDEAEASEKSEAESIPEVATPKKPTARPAQRRKPKTTIKD